MQEALTLIPSFLFVRKARLYLPADVDVLDVGVETPDFAVANLNAAFPGSTGASVRLIQRGADEGAFLNIRLTLRR